MLLKNLLNVNAPNGASKENKESVNACSIKNIYKAIWKLK